MKNPFELTRRGLLGSAAATAALAGLSTGLPALAQSRGDTLRIGAVGSSIDTLDPHRNMAQVIDILRYANLFDGLATLGPDGTPEYALAESITPDASATLWTVRLRPNVSLHDGRVFSAQDVLFSVARIRDKEHPTQGAALLEFLDAADIVATDDLTVEFRLARPYGPFLELWASHYLRMVPQGFDPEAPIGTGAYRHVSFTRARESVFEAFPDHFRGAPAIRSLVITSIADPVAQMNALRGGQIDVAFDMPLSEARIVEADPALSLLRNPTPLSLPIYMRADKPPFDDPRLRRAFQLIPDRDAMVRIALAGNGEAGNDCQGRGPLPGCGGSGIAQRTQDIATAKALLAEAGMTGMSIELATTNGTNGMVECAQVFAEQARLAGVEVKVLNMDPSTYLARYQEWTFGVDFFSADFLSVVKRTLLPGGALNCAHWVNQDFIDLYDQAITTVDPAARCEIMARMRQIEHDDGANILWGFSDTLNAHAPHIRGIEPYAVESIFYNVRKLSLG